MPRTSLFYKIPACIIIALVAFGGGQWGGTGQVAVEEARGSLYCRVQGFCFGLGVLAQSFGSRVAPAAFLSYGCARRHPYPQWQLQETTRLVIEQATR